MVAKDSFSYNCGPDLDTICGHSYQGKLKLYLTCIADLALKLLGQDLHWPALAVVPYEFHRM